MQCKLDSKIKKESLFILIKELCKENATNQNHSKSQN